MNDNFKARLILKGQWLFDNAVSMPIQIFAINFDYYFELDIGYNEEGEGPYLNEFGEQYIIAWHNEKFFSRNGNVALGGLTLGDAVQSTENVVKQKINGHRKFPIITFNCAQNFVQQRFGKKVAALTDNHHEYASHSVSAYFAKSCFVNLCVSGHCKTTPYSTTNIFTFTFDKK
ncbi:MAG TPA: hypothetical protein VGQ09_04555 [Chitinophagaceae bacterium]|jgi:hypothetical protein|nr:hypothetical protein [Chitinophagaceae bacterium]